MVIALPAVFSPWFGHRPLAARITAWWFRIWWMLYVLLEVSTPQFIAEYDTRLQGRAAGRLRGAGAGRLAGRQAVPDARA
ncbi:hypothetical protein G6F64_015178 [Rhizopus arrhizus]|uniref:Uncharacterized protein n=1 Tax=Rhizopus oryzae TaxID=64495 RepID=A0A9P6WSS1_RHIOR|nr:hypothetical protein G6F64_015178 [Rhizopus arrhizus]